MAQSSWLIAVGAGGSSARNPSLALRCCYFSSRCMSPISSTSLSSLSMSFPSATSKPYPARALLTSTSHRQTRLLQFTCSNCDVDLHHIRQPGLRSWSFPVRSYARKYNDSSDESTSFQEAEESPDIDESWIPPDHSPLAGNNSLSTESHQKWAPQKMSDRSRDGATDANESKESIGYGDEIEVIDLESTLNNPLNQELLKDEQVMPSRDHLSDSSQDASFGFEVEDSDLSELLRELKSSGEETMLKSLANEYGLQDQLDLLQDEEGSESLERDTTATAKDSDEEIEWDDEFFHLLENLSEDEIVQEIIESSPSLSELEVEIVSEALEKEGNGELEDLNLEGNTSYNELRSMILDDYYERKKQWSMEKKLWSYPFEDTNEYSNKTVASTTDSGSSSFTPSDWKDYDSNSAFKPDFLQDDSWVPPQNQFVPASNRNEQSPKKSLSNRGPSGANDFDKTIDWLQARRSRLHDPSSNDNVDRTDNPQIPSHLLTPKEAASFRHQSSKIPIRPFTLFTNSELVTSLSAQGGTDIKVIDVSQYNALYGAGLDCNSLIIVTGRNFAHIRVLAESIVGNLKSRKLNERGVMGAIKGIDGGKDLFSSKTSRNRSLRRGDVNTSGKVDDDWMVVDCGNIHVHVLDKTTRKMLNIEGLWDLFNPNSEGSKLRRLNWYNEDEVDTYVAQNPVPDEYLSRVIDTDGNKIRDTFVTGGAGGRVETVPFFNKKSFSEKWSPGKSVKRKRGKQRGK